MNESEIGEDANNQTTESNETATPVVKLNDVMLGDVIQLHAPENQSVDKQIYYVFFANDQKIKLLNTSSHQLLKLNIADTIADQTIVGVDLISRSELPGFARQHKLEPPQWIDVHFGGDMPAVISGEITNLEEDMIEITTYPGMRVIYIDFAYQGIPEHLPIDKIVLRERPASLHTSLRSLYNGTTDISREEIEAEATAEIDEDDGMSILNVPENVAMNPTPSEIVEEYIDHEIEVPNDDIVEDEEEELASMVRLFDVPESERRYSEEMQVADLLGELVSKLAPEQRTTAALKDIHRFVTRFKELRREFSVFDANGEVTRPKQTDKLHKPLIDHIVNLDRDIKWLLPVVYERNELMQWATNRVSDSYDKSITNIETSMTEFVQSIEAVEKAFADKTTTDPTQSIRYDKMMKSMDVLCAPATQTTPADLPENTTVYIANKEVATSMEVLVNNDGEFNMNASIMKSGEAHQSGKHKYTTRRYTPASSRMVLDETVRRRAFDRKPIGSADKANVQSIIMLPRPVLLQSHYKSPSAGLYLKSKLAEIPVYKFLLLRPNTKLHRKEIDKLNEELSYEDAIPNLKTVVNNKAGEEMQVVKKSGEPFLKSPTHYTIASDINVESSEDTFRQLLDVVIPRTRTLVRWMRPSIEHLYSFADIVATLEPFYIESDNITFGQYKEIRYYAKNKILNYRAAIASRRNDFKTLKELDEYASSKLNRIAVILDESREFKNYLLSTYHLDAKNKEDDAGSGSGSGSGSESSVQKIANAILSNSSETLQYLLSVDGAAAYSTILNTFLMQTLTIPESVVGILKAPTISSEDSKAIINSKCYRRFIAKKYRSVAEMRKDDNTPDVFYDKEYDDTPYHLLDKYKDEKKRFRTDEEFTEFFTETLIHRHDCPPHLAPALATSIIAKKKRVRTGEYAMLEIKPTMADKLQESLQEDERRELETEAETRKHVEFYKRVRDTWELDKTVDISSFMDTNTLFCELSETCNKISEVNQCVPSEMAALQMRLSKRARMMEEFEERVAKTFDEVANELRDKLVQMRKQIRRNRSLLQTKLYRQNNYSYELGKYAVGIDTLSESPHVELRERIFAMPDFVAKQTAIYTFCTKLCREPKLGTEEDAHWMYCKDTNTKLFPMSIYRLSRAFIIDPEDYMRLLDTILRENGELSDDGDAIVDKYTGYPLRKIDYSAEEGFDESGFRITTNAVVNNRDVEEMVITALSKKDKIFSSPKHQAVYNVFKTLSENMGIHKDVSEAEIEEFVMRVSIKILEDPNTILGEEAYNNKMMAEQSQKQTKKMPKMPYTTYYNQSLITLTSCATFAAMQTLVPSFKPKKTFPGCVKSFAGYPLDAGNPDNDSGLRYIACVLDKSKRGSSQPWSSIEPLSLDKLLARLKTAMKTIYKLPDVVKLYETKREYLLSNPDTDIPDEVSVGRWIHFQPPVIAIKMDERAITGISEEFEKELFKSMMQGSAEQFKHIGIVKGKLLKHAYAVFELIETVVKKKHMLLSSNAGLAFLENACCNEEGSKHNPLAYFQHERPDLTQMLQKVKKMDEVVGRVKRLTKAKMFFDPKSSRLVGATIPDTIISRMIYETFIHYGNFDNDAPIPNDLLPLIVKKPEYNRFASIDEKIAFMKRHGKHYGVTDFYSIMRIVNGRNMIHLKPDKEIAYLGGLKDMLDYFDDKDSQLVESRLRELLRKTIDEHDPAAAFHEERATNRKLNRYLQRANEKMREVVVAFLDAHANLNNNQLNRIEQFLNQITVWEISDVPTVTKEIENMVYNLAKVYPNKVLANRFQAAPPRHWGFAPKHLLKLEESASAFYATIASFSDKNPNSTFSRYLSMTVASLTDLSLFLQQIPIMAPLIREGVAYWSFYTYDTVMLLHEYCLLSVLHEYVVLANDREFVQMMAEEIQLNPAEDPFAFENVEDDMPEDYGVTNQIRQVHIVESDSTELKKTAAAFLSAVIQREQETKHAFNHGYAQIMNATMALKYKDKKHITDHMKKLERDERRVEQALRSHKIGRWNIGMQKGLYQYDTNVYEQELELWDNADATAIENSIEQATDTILERLNRLDRARMSGNEAEDLEAIEEQERSAEYDGGDGWDNLNEDYTNGVYYEEDAERDDYDEY